MKTNQELTLNQFKQKYMLRGQLQEVHKITQWKDGYIWKTIKIGYIVTQSYNGINTDKGTIVSLSNNEAMELNKLPLWCKRN